MLLELTYRRIALAGLGLALLADSAPAASPPVFARLTADREGICREEQFRLTLSLFSSGVTLGRQISMSGMPPATVARIGPFEELANESSVIEGRVYEVRRYRTQVRVHAPGELRLAPRFEGTRTESVRQNWFVQTRQEPITIPVEPLVLPILDLPAEGRPADFSGAVGQFTLAVTAAPLTVAVGDLITVTATVAGEGLPEHFTPPAVTPGPGIKLYDVNPLPGGAAADRRAFEQTVVAAEPFATAIPPVTFTFFNPRLRRYQTAAQGPFPLTFQAERAPLPAVYTPPPATSRPPATAVAAPPAVPGPLARTWGALTGRHYAVLRPSAPGATRFAPAAEAPVLFTVKPGTRVRIDAETDAWTRIICSDGIGWLPAASLARE
jgi:hypothetical protein